MTDSLKLTLAKLPNCPGVYFHIDSNGDIIYVGKALNLKNRVRQYFSGSSKQLSSKDVKLRHQIADIKWRTVDNGLQALYLESELIKRYQPKYNVLSRNPSFDNWYYLAFNFSKHPSLRLVRNVDQAPNCQYLGPYLDGRLLKIILKYIRKYFPFSSHKTVPKTACLDYHLGLCPGPEVAGFDTLGATKDLKAVQAFLSGKQSKLMGQLQAQMLQASQDLNFEQAAKLRNQLQALKDFKQSLIFKDRQFWQTNSDQALTDLKSLFNLDTNLNRIEVYDISHISGSYVVASMVVALGGMIEPTLSRRFKTRFGGNNDFAQIKSIIARRFQMPSLKQIYPNLIIIDGGKAQVSAVSRTLVELDLNIKVVGLAKRREQIIFCSKDLNLNNEYLANLDGTSLTQANFTTLDIPPNSHIIKFLQRLRDASHRKAITYHKHLRAKAQTRSELLDIPSIGPQTHAKLIKQFESLQAIAEAQDEELLKIVSYRQLQALKQYFKSNQ